MKRVQLVDVRSVRERLCDLLFHSADMPQKERRQKLIDAMKAWEDEYPSGVIVNRHHCANTHKDKDLQWLIKHNKLSVHRMHSKCHARFAETFLRVVR